MKAFKLLDAGAARKAVELLEENYRDAKYYLNFGTPTDLIVAAILSAQTHDEVVNSVTPELFKRYRTTKDYANADREELIKHISRVTFAGNKARNIIRTCQIIDEKYGGKVPDTMEALLELPGIGRKTANTILINAYGVVVGIPVDVWVIKLSGRIGLSANKDPDKIEQDLLKIVDKKYWKNITYVMKRHGKATCQSIIPVCSKCFLGPNESKICPRNSVVKSA